MAYLILIRCNYLAKWIIKIILINNRVGIVISTAPYDVSYVPH